MFMRAKTRRSLWASPILMRSASPFSYMNVSSLFPLPPSLTIPLTLPPTYGCRHRASPVASDRAASCVPADVIALRTTAFPAINILPEI